MWSTPSYSSTDHSRCWLTIWVLMIGREAHTLNPYPKTLTPLIQPYSHGMSLSSSIADVRHVWDYNAGIGGIKVFAWRVSFDWCTPRRDQPNSIPDAQHAWNFSNDAFLVYICNLNRAYSTLNRAPWSTESTYSALDWDKGINDRSLNPKPRGAHMVLHGPGSLNSSNIPWSGGCWTRFSLGWAVCQWHRHDLFCRDQCWVYYYLLQLE